MNKFNIIMDNVYNYDGDFIVGEIVKEYVNNLWLSIPYNNKIIECQEINIIMAFNLRAVQVIEKCTGKVLCFNKQGGYIEDLAEYFMLNTSNITTQAYKQDRYTEYEHLEEDLNIIVERRKLWDTEYLLVNYEEWRGLWDINNKEWKILSNKMYIDIEKSELGIDNLDYIKLVEKGEARGAKVLLKGFREVAFNDSGSISLHRLSEDLWFVYDYAERLRCRLIRVKEDNSIEQLIELKEDEFSYINNVKILTCSLGRGDFDIVDKHRNCIVAKPFKIIVLEGCTNGIYIDDEYQSIYEINSETMHGDALNKCNDIRRDGMTIYYKDEAYETVNYSNIIYVTGNRK